MTQRNAKIRVGLVDDHPVVREGLRSFLQLAEDIEVVAEAGSGREAIEVAQTIAIDVLLMDLVMEGEHDGITATRQISRAHPEIRILALTSFQDATRMMSVIEAGAISYLQKDVSPDHLLSAIRQTAAGRTVLEPSALLELRRTAITATPESTPAQTPTSRSTSASTPTSTLSNRADVLRLVDPLTQREQEVLHALANGLSNKEIAAKLGIAEKTVKVHVSHILGKLGVYDRTQALLAAAKLGLVHLDG